MQKIKKGDKVKVLLGKDRDKTGNVERVLIKKGKVVILGVNTYKRHVKRQGEVEGRIIEIVKPIDISNVLLICPNCNKPTRVGFKKDNELLRICKKCGKVITNAKR